MATDATGTPTAKGIPKYDTQNDAPSGLGFNAAMDAIDSLLGWIKLRKNSGGADFERGRLNLIEGSGITITVADDAGNNEIDVTIATAGGGVPAGAVSAYAGASAPSGWLLCDGSAVSRTTYADLFTAIGTAYGAGDGSTTFNVPDLRGRSPVGKGSNATVSTLGNSDGVAEANRRGTKHRHTAHSHTTQDYNQGGNNTYAGFQRGDGGAGSQGAVSTSSVDGGSGNSNDPLDGGAYLVVNYIIKT